MYTVLGVGRGGGTVAFTIYTEGVGYVKAVLIWHLG